VLIFMAIQVVLLFVLAIVPFYIVWSDPTGAHYRFLSGNGYLWFCIPTGVLWCSVFTYFFVRASARDRLKLLFLSPLALFAFGEPACWLILWLMFTYTFLSKGLPG